MFSETTRQVMFVSGVGLLHAVIMMMCWIGVLPIFRAHPLWRAFCAIVLVVSHGLFIPVLVTADDGVPMGAATIIISAADLASLLLVRLFRPRSVAAKAG